MTAPLLSVITACYDHARFLPECIESVSRQTVRDIEHIVIDDASPDNSRAIMLTAAATDPRVCVLVNARNRGLAASQNIGIAEARAPWVLKVDADDWISPTYVEEILDAALEDDRRNVIFSPAHIFGCSETGTPIDRVYVYKAFDAAHMIDTFMIPGPAAFRKSLWEAVGGYDETMRSGEDWDLYVRAQQVVGLVPHQLPEARWHYRQHRGVRASDHGMQRLTYLKTYWRGHTRETVLARSRTWGAWCAERKVAA